MRFFPCVSFPLHTRSCVYRAYTCNTERVRTQHGDEDGYVGSGWRISFEYGRQEAQRARDNDAFVSLSRDV